MNVAYVSLLIAAILIAPKLDEREAGLWAAICASLAVIFSILSVIMAVAA